MFTGIEKISTDSDNLVILNFGFKRKFRQKLECSKIPIPTL